MIAKTQREIIDKRQAPIWARYKFWNDSEVRHNPKAKRERITKKGDLYLSEDEKLCRQFWDDCDAANRAAGFTGPKDNCPALMAENQVIQAQTELINLALPLLGLKDDRNIWGETREKMLECLIGLAVSDAPARK